MERSGGGVSRQGPAFESVAPRAASEAGCGAGERARGSGQQGCTRGLRLRHWALPFHCFRKSHQQSYFKEAIFEVSCPLGQVSWFYKMTCFGDFGESGL